MPGVTQEISTHPGSQDPLLYLSLSLLSPKSLWPDSKPKQKDHADHGIPQYSRSSISYTQQRLRNILKYLHTLSVLLSWGAVALQTEIVRCQPRGIYQEKSRKLASQIQLRLRTVACTNIPYTLPTSRVYLQHAQCKCGNPCPSPMCVIVQ